MREQTHGIDVASVLSMFQSEPAEPAPNTSPAAPSCFQLRDLTLTVIFSCSQCSKRTQHFLIHYRVQSRIVYIYIHSLSLTHTHTHRERETHTQTHTHTETQTHTH